MQHRLEEQADVVRRLIVEEGGHVYVAGNAKQMPDQVRSFFFFLVAFQVRDQDIAFTFVSFWRQRSAPP